MRSSFKFPLFAFSLSALVIFFSLPAFAHDPYEITSTIRIETNRTLVEIEMEFNGAMLLAGGPRSQKPEDQPALFQSKLSELQHQAGQFFEITGVAGSLSASSTNVTLGNENHVKFSLEYPATRSGLKLNAAGLKSLSEHGPFGTTVTVLDMVNSKVLGQPVLFASNPTADFTPQPATFTPTNTLAAIPQINIPPATNPITAPTPTSPKPAKVRESVWNFVILGLYGAILVVLLRRWRAAGGQ